MSHSIRSFFVPFVCLSLLGSGPISADETQLASKPDHKTPVTVENFIRAESDLYFGKTIKENGIGKLVGLRTFTPIDQQSIVRMNRDTLYSSAVFDLDAAPVTITLPDAGKRFLSMQVISQDHYTIDVVYQPAKYTYSKHSVGTRYVFVIIRILANPNDPADIAQANALQDKFRVEQSKLGQWDAVDWDHVSQNKIRDALALLGSVMGHTKGNVFGKKSEVDPVLHLIGTAVGWGGNPKEDAIYSMDFAPNNDGKQAYTLTVKDVPVGGFWSVSVYNAKGFFEKNDYNAYSLNNLTAEPNADGSFTLYFGGQSGVPNNLPITPGWNYTVRLYRPQKAILDGTWKFPALKDVK